MAHQTPFTAYLKIVPDRRSGKRVEIQRSRERMAHLIYSDLKQNQAFTSPNMNADATFAEPGGSQTYQIEEDVNPDVDGSTFSNMASGFSVKPQFGQYPDTITIVGFFNFNSINTPYNEKKLIHCGSVVSGPGGGRGYSVNTEPSTDNRANAKTLYNFLTYGITSVNCSVIKIDIAGVIYGNGGLHFNHI